MADVNLEVPDLVLTVKGLSGLNVTGMWSGGNAQDVSPGGPLTIASELELFNPNQVEVVINPASQVSVVDAGAGGIFENYEFDKDAQGVYVPWILPPRVGELHGSAVVKVYITLSAARRHNQSVIVRLSGVGTHED